MLKIITSRGLDPLIESRTCKVLRQKSQSELGPLRCEKVKAIEKAQGWLGLLPLSYEEPKHPSPLGANNLNPALSRSEKVKTLRLSSTSPGFLSGTRLQRERREGVWFRFSVRVV